MSESLLMPLWHTQSLDPPLPTAHNSQPQMASYPLCPRAPCPTSPFFSHPPPNTSPRKTHFSSWVLLPWLQQDMSVPRDYKVTFRKEAYSIGCQLVKTRQGNDILCSWVLVYRCACLEEIKMISFAQLKVQSHVFHLTISPTPDTARVDSLECWRLRLACLILNSNIGL